MIQLLEGCSQLPLKETKECHWIRQDNLNLGQWKIALGWAGLAKMYLLGVGGVIRACLTISSLSSQVNKSLIVFSVMVLCGGWSPPWPRSSHTHLVIGWSKSKPQSDWVGERKLPVTQTRVMMVNPRVGEWVRKNYQSLRVTKICCDDCSEHSCTYILGSCLARSPPHC